MEQLYRMGFFGKGDLSRHRPEYNRGGYWGIKKRRGLHGNEEVVRVVSRRRYLRHLAWKEGESGTGAGARLGEETTLLGEETTELPQSKKLKMVQEVGAGSVRNRVESHDFPDQPGISSESHGNIDQSRERIHSDSESDSDTRNSDFDWPKQQEEPCDWPITNAGDDPWAFWDTKASEDFWGTDSMAETESKGHEDGKVEQVIQKEGEVEKNVQITPSTPPVDISQKQSGLVQELKFPSTDQSNRLEQSGFDFSPQSSEAKGDSQSTVDTSYAVGVPQSSGATNLSEPSISDKVKIESTDKKGVREQTESEDDIKDTQSSEVSNHIQPTSRLDVNTDTQNKKANTEETESGIDTNLDPRCLIEESSGKLLVVDDSDNSDCEWPETRTKWRPVRKHEPYPVKENLCLTLEEAFFLSYALGCLVVLKKDNSKDKNKDINEDKNHHKNKDENSEPMNLSEMWREFCRIQSNFPTHYAAYHHYRAKGWVPKVGIKFGADLILYRDGPPFNHSSYSVMIKTVNDLDLKPDPKYDREVLTWRSLSAFNRVTEQVNKEVLLCYVVRPGNLSESELNSPECIKKFRIQEMIIHRWVSSQEREQSDSDLPT